MMLILLDSCQGRRKKGGFCNIIEAYNSNIFRDAYLFFSKKLQDAKCHLIIRNKDRIHIRVLITQLFDP